MISSRNAYLFTCTYLWSPDHLNETSNLFKIKKPVQHIKIISYSYICWPAGWTHRRPRTDPGPYVDPCYPWKSSPLACYNRAVGTPNCIPCCCSGYSRSCSCSGSPRGSYSPPDNPRHWSIRHLGRRNLQEQSKPSLIKMERKNKLCR